MSSVWTIKMHSPNVILLPSKAIPEFPGYICSKCLTSVLNFTACSAVIVSVHEYVNDKVSQILPSPLASNDVLRVEWPVPIVQPILDVLVSGVTTVDNSGQHPCHAWSRPDDEVFTKTSHGLQSKSQRQGDTVDASSCCQPEGANSFSLWSFHACQRRTSITNVEISPHPTLSCFLVGSSFQSRHSLLTLEIKRCSSLLSLYC